MYFTQLSMIHIAAGNPCQLPHLYWPDTGELLRTLQSHWKTTVCQVKPLSIIYQSYIITPHWFDFTCLLIDCSFTELFLTKSRCLLGKRMLHKCIYLVCSPTVKYEYMNSRMKYWSEVLIGSVRYILFTHKVLSKQSARYFLCAQVLNISRGFV